MSLAAKPARLVARIAARIPRRYVWSEGVSDAGGSVYCESVPWPIAIIGAWLDQADEVTHTIDRLTGYRIKWSSYWGNPFCAADLFIWKAKVELRFTTQETHIDITHDQLTAKTRAWWAKERASWDDE